MATWQNYTDWQEQAEQPWNKRKIKDSEETEYVLTPDEMCAKLEQDLLDAVNRKEREPSRAADRGTCFNEIVDCLIENRNSNRKDVVLHTSRNKEGQPVAIIAEMDGFTFQFDVDMCRNAAKYFKGSVTQQYVEAPMQTCYGNVLLYGYIDEWVKDKMYDIKTTTYYTPWKFESGLQRHVYPWCAIESGLIDNISEFEYTVFKLNTYTKARKGEDEQAVKERHDNMLSYATDIQVERYGYDHKQSGEKLREMCERFIEWLQVKDSQGLITCRRVFNGQDTGRKEEHDATQAMTAFNA